MKNFFKKFIIAICTVSASAALLTASFTVNAEETPRPQSAAGQFTASDTVNNTSTGAVDNNNDTSASTGVTANTVTQSTGKASSKSGGGFWWFLLSVAVNFVLSCWVGNRFYRMARKSAQGSAEIRALRKDIEEKFAGTIRDISEPATEVMNRNESYARNDDGIGMPERKSHVELNDDEIEMMKRWDAKRTASRPVRQAEAFDESDYEDEAPSKTIRRNAYQPLRRSAGIEFDDEGYDDEYDDDMYDERQSSHMPVRNEKPSPADALSNAKNKAKDFLSNVFPFDE